MAKRKKSPIPLEGPLSGNKVFELVRTPHIFGGETDGDPILGIEPVASETIYKVKAGFKCEYQYFQSIDGKLVQGFKKHELLVI